MVYDAIVIGSGIGGMYAASLLAKEGLKVIVLERFAVAGGLMHAFKRRGEFFPTGVHYIGALKEGQTLWRYFKYAGILDKVTFEPFDEDCYEEYYFPDYEFRIPNSHKAFEERLLSLFPNEKTAIRRFMSDMRASCDGFGLFNVRPPADRWPEFASQDSLSDYLNALTSDKRLQKILSANNPLYGLPPEECPVFVHFLVFDSFLQGSWRVKGGSHLLAKAFVASLKELGVEVRTSAEVKEICVQGDTATGVRLANGEVLEAKKVIYTGHTKHIFDLLPPQAFRPAFKSRLLSLEETVSFFGVCLVLKDYKEGFDARNLYIYAHDDYARCYQQKITESGAQPEMVYCSLSREAGSPDATATLLTSMPYSEVAQWKDSQFGARPSDYRHMKEAVTKKVMGFVQSRLPKLLENATVVSTFTPLTMKDYVSAWNGSLYGVKKSVSQLRSGKIMPRTRVKGLFLAGQNVEMSGILGTVIGSVSCCCEIFGPEYLMGKINRETS